MYFVYFVDRLSECQIVLISLILIVVTSLYLILPPYYIIHTSSPSPYLFRLAALIPTLTSSPSTSLPSTSLSSASLSSPYCFHLTVHTSLSSPHRHPHCGSSSPPYHLDPIIFTFLPTSPHRPHLIIHITALIRNALLQRTHMSFPFSIALTSLNTAPMLSPSLHQQPRAHTPCHKSRYTSPLHSHPSTLFPNPRPPQRPSFIQRARIMHYTFCQSSRQ
jgi:hypothetical protein